MALCRPYSEETFAFLVPDGDGQYKIMHRTGIHLLSLVWDSNRQQVDGWTASGAQVLHASITDSHVVGSVIAHVDAGFIFCAFIGARMHLQAKAAAAAAFDDFREQATS